MRLLKNEHAKVVVVFMLLLFSTCSVFVLGHEVATSAIQDRKKYFIKKESLDFNFGEEKSAIIRKDLDGVDDPEDWIKFQLD